MEIEQYTTKNEWVKVEKVRSALCGWLGWCVILLSRGLKNCRFDPWLAHIKEATD